MLIVFYAKCKTEKKSDCFIDVDYKGNSSIRVNLHPPFSVGIDMNDGYIRIRQVRRQNNSILLVKPTDRIIRIDNCGADELANIDYFVSPSNKISKLELLATLEEKDLIGKISEIEIIRQGKRLILSVGRVK